MRVIGPVPGGQPGFGEQERRWYAPDLFVIDQAGGAVDLLAAACARRITAAQMLRLGTILSDLILPGMVRERFRGSLRVVREREQRLRLRLTIEARELRPLPWELLCLPPPGEAGPTDGDFLALQPDISIVRHEAIGEIEPRLETRRRYRLVAALAAPKDQPPLQLAADRRAIARAIKQVASAGGEARVQPDWLKGATRDALEAALARPADIFHFSGHGSFDGQVGSVILDQGDGMKSDFVSARTLAALLQRAGSVWERTQATERLFHPEMAAK